jgi:two-component system cell cycle response regulator DivK
MNESPIILYVEDNAENRLLVQRVLFADGFRVIEAQDAEQALAIIAEKRPDVILMDINMPDMDGYTLTNQIKGMTGMQGVPVIALTANVMRGDRERSYQAGCDGYIQKPIDVDLLPAQINAYLALSNQH